MKYAVGDYVVPNDLPKRWVCRVAEVECKALEGGDQLQILSLAPLAGPWRPGTLLVRLDGAVRPAEARGRMLGSIAQAAGDAKRAHDRRSSGGRAKVIRLPVRPRRISIPEPDAGIDARE